MKKTSPAASPPSADHQAVESVVTRLRARSSATDGSPLSSIDMDALRVAIDELPTLDATKVVSLHRRIVNGDYKIDSQRLAEKLIDLESSLDD